MSLFKMMRGSEGKSQVDYSTPTAGAVTVDEDEIALWVVTSIYSPVNLPLSLHSFVNDCLERLRESGTPTSAPGLFTVAHAAWINSLPDKRSITVAKDTAFSAPASNGVQIYIGDLFQPLPGTSVSTAVKRLLETWMERVAKKAA